MEYSLNYLNLICKVKGLTITEFINSLNLIGIEVDEVSKKPIKSGYCLDTIKFFLKIPSNRHDLLIEDFFLDELSVIFLFNLVKLWENIKKKYKFLLRQKYLEYSNYLTVPIETTIPSFFTYIIEVKNFQNISSPMWIHRKLNNSGISVEENYEDLINLTILEWGQYITSGSLVESLEPFSNYSVSILDQSEIFIERQQKKIELPKKSIVLKNKENEILSVLGILNKIEKNSTEQIFLQLSFYDIEKNESVIELYNPKNSLKYFRKMVIEKLKVCFQRLLTLTEILGYGKICPIKYCTPEQNNFRNFSKILTVSRKNFIDILGICDINDKILKKTGFPIICKTQTDFHFKILNARKDVVREIDFLEEYSRFFGFKNFKEIYPTKKKGKIKNLNKILFFKQFLLNYGFHEVITNSISEISKENTRKVEITNPLTKELSCLRRSLLPQLVEIFETNFRITSGIGTNNFFEIGRTYQKFNSQIIEEEKISAIFQLPKASQSSLDWFLHLGFLENLLYSFGYSNLVKEKLNFSHSLLHPKRSILLKTNNKIIGIFGQLNPSYKKNSLFKTPVYLFELNLIHFDNLSQYSKIPSFKEYSKYPKITKDLSCLISKDTNFSELKKWLEKSSEYLKRSSFFDIYFEKTSEKFINVGIRFEFQSLLTTLTTEKIENEFEKIKENLCKIFEVKIA